MNITPEQAVKLAILLWADSELSTSLAAEEIERRYDQLVENDGHWDARSEVREGDVETSIPAECSRHYESKSVATKVGDKWVGWTYWYGGGKHAEPDAIDWMDKAYFLDCVEEKKLVTVQTFTKSAQK